MNERLDSPRARRRKDLDCWICGAKFWTCWGLLRHVERHNVERRGKP